MRALRAQKSESPMLAHRTANSTCPVCTGHPGGPTSQKLQRSESNGSDDVAGAPDMSGVHRTVRCAIEHHGGPRSQDSNDRFPTALVMWRGHRTVRCAPDCPVRHRTDRFPTATFGGWGYKYPNHPTIHCIQVLYFPTTTRALAFNSRHTKEIKSSPNSTQRPSD